MSIRRVAIVVILIFLGQQAGSVWAGVMFSGHSHGLPSVASVADDAMAGHCDSTEQAHHADVMESVAESETEDCCNLECECCVGHCQSTLALIPLSIDVYSSNHSRFQAASQSTRTTSQSHFRPPIFA